MPPVYARLFADAAVTWRIRDYHYEQANNNSAIAEYQYVMPLYVILIRRLIYVVAIWRHVICRHYTIRFRC